MGYPAGGLDYARWIRVFELTMQTRHTIDGGTNVSFVISIGDVLYTSPNLASCYCSWLVPIYHWVYCYSTLLGLSLKRLHSEPQPIFIWRVKIQLYATLATLETTLFLCVSATWFHIHSKAPLLFKSRPTDSHMRPKVQAPRSCSDNAPKSGAVAIATGSDRDAILTPNPWS